MTDKELACSILEEPWNFDGMLDEYEMLRIGNELLDAIYQYENATFPGTFGLALYCCKKALAMRYRKEGKINLALKFEEQCDNIYKQLPDWAKW